MVPFLMPGKLKTGKLRKCVRECAMASLQRAGTPAATALVVASMIGTGVFTSLGFQLIDFSSAPVILALWAIGGVIALCGAVSYAELAGTLHKSGGEYVYLGTIYHPSLGFMAGLLSAIVGFAAPTALTAIAIGRYMHSSFANLPAGGIAAIMIVLATLAHAISGKTSARVQVIATALKLLLILGFLAAAMTMPSSGDIRWQVESSDPASLLAPAFSISLLYVFYSYSGWNAAVYGLEEWHEPARTVRRALVIGTLSVLALYLALNAAFLRAAPMEELRGVVEVGHVAALHLFGKQTAGLISCLLALGLFASLSALLWAGPRVLGAMGRDLPALSFFAARGHVPKRALIFQALLALLLVTLDMSDVVDFEMLLAYTQTGLTLSTLLTVAGVLVLRIKRPELPRHVKVPWYPLPPLIFLLITGWVTLRALQAKPGPVLAGFYTAVICALLWFPLHRRKP